MHDLVSFKSNDGSLLYQDLIIGQGVYLPHDATQAKHIKIPCKCGPGHSLENDLLFDGTMIGNLTLFATISPTENPSLKPQQVTVSDEEAEMAR